MFKIRSKGIPNRPLVEIVATHDHLPLKDEEWDQRWCTLNKKFEECFQKIWNIEVRTDDIFLTGFTKSGTTWMQEILWLLQNQLNFQRAKEEDLMQRTAMLDFSGFPLENPMESIEMCNKLSSPRVIKSHLPVNLLPKQLWEKKPKTIYMARNVKDVVVSFNHFYFGLSAIKYTMEEYVQFFVSDAVWYAPYWKHVIDFWKMRHEPHIFFVTYEDLKRDLKRVLQKLCIFLERPQLTELEMKMMLEHLSFEAMKNNKKTNCTDFYKSVLPSYVDENFQFMRRGIIGSYKEELSAESRRILNEWSTECLARHGIKEEDIFGNV